MKDNRSNARGSGFAMRRRLATAMVVISLAGVAFASSETLGGAMGSDTSRDRSPSAAEFVSEAALSDMFETATSELAAIRADEPTRGFAARMNEDHQKTSSELSMLVKPHVTDWPLPERLNDKHQAMLDELKKLDGRAFTEQYHRYQVSTHEDAVTLFQLYGESGDDAKLKAFAQKTLPHLQGHLKMAQELSQ